MSRIVSLETLDPTRFPRVSGDEPKGNVAKRDRKRFSPRERG